MDHGFAGIHKPEFYENRLDSKNQNVLELESILKQGRINRLISHAIKNGEGD